MPSKWICELIALLGALSLANTAPIADRSLVAHSGLSDAFPGWVRSREDPRHEIPNGTVDVAMTATNNTTPISIWNDFNSTYSTLGKRAPITLYLPGCTSVLSRNSQNPTALKKSGPFHFSPQGGLYLTNRLENAQAMIRLDPTKCSSVNIDGRISKFMIATYEFDDAGLRIMDLDNWHWYQHHDNIQPSLPVWWDNQSLHIIPYKGPNSQNAEIYQRYLSSHIVIGTLAPATHYGPGLTDLFTLWVFKTAYDPDHTGELRMVNPIDPISKLKYKGRYIQ
ncbi:hypothetical protein F5879DRAFT_982387 [Lentinula edodes]|nr:hypothetical protein F5879DRAFT_982387 [Lentinula edodes]